MHYWDPPGKGSSPCLCKPLVYPDLSRAYERNPRGWPKAQGCICLLNPARMVGGGIMRSMKATMVSNDMNYLQIIHNQHSIVTQIQELNLWNKFLVEKKKT